MSLRRGTTRNGRCAATRPRASAWLPALLAIGGCIEPTSPVAIGGGGGGGGPPTGTVEITVTTTGSNVDPNGYQLLFNEETSYPIGANGQLSLTVVAGSYQVTLVDLAANCAVEGTTNPQAFNVSGGTTAAVSFAVACA